MTEHFDVDAVLRKWGFLRYNPSHQGPSNGAWYGDLDGQPCKVMPDAKIRFATQLLMRN